jgi:hypothetical protein
MTASEVRGQIEIATLRPPGRPERIRDEQLYRIPVPLLR